MKPKMLKITGLNSFSQTEVIDFSILTEKGLFGIFGPTGSGKSTVLDAITLALYGRLARDTKSYINSDCEKTNIYFEFLSGHGSDRKKYIIDRTIKRTKTGTQTANVILEVHSENGGRENIIEKRLAVEKELIENIVKLNFEDFIRTVVLPQGKFSEFLTLTGAERNNMLERILGLEEYGKVLNEKINIKKSNTNSELDKLQGERSRFSDSSPEKIKELESLKEDMLKEEELLKVDIERLDIDYKRYSNIYELQKELKEYQTKNKTLIADEVVANAKEKKLNLGKDALNIVPFIDSFDLNVGDRSKNSKKLKTLKDELGELTKNLDKIEADYKDAYYIKERDSDNLIEKRTRLGTAISLEIENIKIKELLDKEKNQHIYREEKLIESCDSLRKVKMESEKLESEITDCEDIIRKKGISSSYRKKLIYGMDIEKRHIEYKKYLEKSEEEFDELKKRIEKGKMKIDGLRKIEDLLKGDLEDNKEVYMDLKRILYTKEENLKNIDIEIEKVKEKLLAHRLAQNLSENCPCPVCGSKSHPDIIKGVDDTELSEKQKLKGNLEKEIQQLFTDIHLIESLFRTNKVKFWDLEDELSKIDIKRDPKLDVDDYKEKCEILKTNLEDINAKKLDLDKKHIEYSTLLENIKENLKNSEVEKQKIKEELSKIKTDYEDIKKDLKVEDIKAQYEKVSALEEELELLNGKLNNYRNKFKDVKRSKDELEKYVNSEKMELEKLRSSITNREELIEKNSMDISKVAGDQSPTDLKLRIENTLREIIKNEKDLRENLESLKDRSTKLKENIFSAESLDEKLKGDIEKTSQRISSLLDEYKFESVELVRSSALEKSEIEELEAYLEKYKIERENVRSNIERIEKSLHGESITYEKLTYMKTEKLEKDKRQQELLEEKGSTIEKLSEMNKGIKRVREIDQEIKTFEIRKDSLDEIGKITKGKRFVEFVARNHLKYIGRVATEKLKSMTRDRYALVLNSESVFEIVDNYNGGITRECSSLSGGETFLTSLALALALSTKIQLKGNTSMEFFFLDEGFGTLDIETLDTAMTALEKLYAENLSVGIISHVEEIKNRVPVKLMVSQPVPGVSGSKVKIERT